MAIYIYKGPVTSFEKCICDMWEGKTAATSPNKAKSNLAFQYKKEHNLANGARIELPGEIKECM